MNKITLATLDQATEQEVFDQVAAHLLTQNKESENDNGECLYRAENGAMCAAGCLMSDEEHKNQWEGMSWHDVSKNTSITKHESLITDLQKLHDAVDVEDWKKKLKVVTGNYRLNTAILDQFKGE